VARPLRIEFPGALYRVTSRGDRREAIFPDDSDRAQFLTLLGEACERFDAAVQAYCLMGNHYHVVLSVGPPARWHDADGHRGAAGLVAGPGEPAGGEGAAGGWFNTRSRSQPD
jgi:hypothetical protein